MLPAYSDAIWLSLGKTLERISPYVGFLFVVIAALAFVQGNHFASYIFLLVAYVFLAGFTLRWLADQELLRNLALATLSVATFAWVGFNLLQDFRATEGIVVSPARSGETLILLAELDKRGTRNIDYTARIRERISDDIQKARLQNVRLATIGATQQRIGDRVDARKAGMRHQATFVIWGWYDDNGAHPDFVVVPAGTLNEDVPRLSELSVTSVDAAFEVREGLPHDLSYFTQFVLGQLLTRAERLADALDAYEAAEGYAKTAQVAAGLGSLYFQRAVTTHLLDYDLNVVVDGYTRAIEASLDLAAAYYNRSVARNARGDPPAQVFADYARAVEQDSRLIPFAYLTVRGLPQTPGKAATLAKLQAGIQSYEAGDNDQAIEQFTDALAANDSYFAPYYFRARAHHVRGEFGLAIDDYTRFLSKSSDYPRIYVAYAYYARALARRLSGMQGQAIEDFDAYLQAAPPDDPFRTPAEFYKKGS